MLRAGNGTFKVSTFQSESSPPRTLRSVFFSRCVSCSWQMQTDASEAASWHRVHALLHYTNLFSQLLVVPLKTRFCSLNLVLPGCTRVWLHALKCGLVWRGRKKPQQPAVSHIARSEAGGTGKGNYKTKLSRKRPSHHQPLPILKQLLCNYEGNSILCSKSSPLWQTLRKKLCASHDRSL